MFYGDEVIVSHSTVRISPKALQPIGIIDDSRCWGMWQPNVSADDSTNPPHLLVSSFYPENWPILFRLILRIRDAPGTAAQVAQALNNNSFNIISTESIPSGHRHMTWTLIGEALTLKDELAKLQIPPIPRDKDVSEQPQILEFVSKQFSPLMFRYSQELERLIINDNQLRIEGGEPGYLHDRFVHQQTLLYDVREMSEEDIDIAGPQLLKAVQCDWLQNFAAFWLFSENRHNPIQFRYSGSSALLRPEGSGVSLFTDEVKKHIPDPPIVAIGSFSHQEHYVRIALPRKAGRRLRIKVPYSCTFPHTDSAAQSSRGLLSAVMQELARREVNIDYVLNSTSELTTQTEVGSISFLCSAPNNRMSDDDLASALRLIEGGMAKIDQPRVSVGRLGAKTVFISTRLKWATEIRRKFLDRVKELVKEYGFVPETGETTHEPARLEEIIARRIRTSHAFLQIIPPREATKYDEDPIYWVTYELGIARGAGLPISLCVDDKFDDAEIRPLRGWYTLKFSSGGNTEDILEQVKTALHYLQEQVYEGNLGDGRHGGTRA